MTLIKSTCNHAIDRSHPVVTTLESEFSNIIVQFIKPDSDTKPSIGMGLSKLYLSFYSLLCKSRLTHSHLCHHFIFKESHIDSG